MVKPCLLKARVVALMLRSWTKLRCDSLLSFLAFNWASLRQKLRLCAGGECGEARFWRWMPLVHRRGIPSVAWCREGRPGLCAIGRAGRYVGRRSDRHLRPLGDSVSHALRGASQNSFCYQGPFTSQQIPQCDLHFRRSPTALGRAGDSRLRPRVWRCGAYRRSSL